jgi:hypothetical protein
MRVRRAFHNGNGLRIVSGCWPPSVLLDDRRKEIKSGDWYLLIVLT